MRRSRKELGRLVVDVVFVGRYEKLASNTLKDSHDEGWW